MMHPAAIAGLMALAPVATNAVPPPTGALGTWSNPAGTLAVRTAPCAGGLCGTVVWAAPQALADARDAGVAHLIGTQLLQNYRQAGTGQWRGRVYVPDMGHSFSSRIAQTAPDRLTISGCLIGGLFCRSQVWHRQG